jgi:putative flippase GtrA
VNDDARVASRLKWLWDLHGDKLRYLIVGGWNTLFGYLLFLLLLALIGQPLHSLQDSAVPLLRWMGSAYYVVVSWVGWLAAVPQSTLTMKYLVFRRRGHALRQVAKAYLVYIPSQLGGSVILWLVVQIFGLRPEVGALVTIGVTTVSSYLGHKYFTFRDGTGAEADAKGEQAVSGQE